MIFSKKLLSVFLIVIVLAAAVYFLFLHNSKTEGAVSSTAEEEFGQEAEEKAEHAAMPVNVSTCRIADLKMKQKYPGEAATKMKIEMKSEIGGIIEKIHVTESMHVKKGQLLVDLDKLPYQRELERAEASRLKVLSDYLMEQKFEIEDSGDVDQDKKKQLMAIEQEFKKARDLYEKGLISKGDFETAEEKHEIALIILGTRKEEIRKASKQLTQNDISVKEAKTKLEKTEIRAPFSGIITGINISPGETISVGRDLFTLVNIDLIKIHARVLESEIGKIKLGREAFLKFSTYPDKKYLGIVEAVSPLIDPKDRTCQVIIKVNNQDEEIKPGMHADVEIVTDIYPNRLLVPHEAVLFRGTEHRPLVFVVEGKIAKWCYVQLGLENEEFYEILEGVNDGDTVIIAGHESLAHDAPITIVE